MAAAAVRSGDGDSPPNGGERRHPTEILFLVCAAQFMVILDVAVVNVALPSIRVDLGFSETGLQWVVNAYTLTFGGLLLLGGRAGDLLGRKRMFLVGLAVFTVASLLGGIAPNEGTLVAARALQGVGGAIVAPATLAILATTFTAPRERARAFAAWGAVAAAGGSTGALVGGLLTEVLSWRWVLFVNVPIGIVLIWLAIRDLPADRADRFTIRDFDLAGAATATLGLSAIVYGIVRTETIGWGAAETWIAIGGGLALVAIFILIEARFAKRPLMPLGVFHSRQLTAANASIFMLGAAMFAMWFFLSLYIQQVLGFTPIETGLAFLPQTVFLALGSSQAARIVGRFGIRNAVVTGFLTLALGLGLLTRISGDGSYLADVFGPSILIGIGLGLCMVPLATAAVSGAEGRDAGLASGLANVSRMVGGALGLAILATIATTHAHDELAALGTVPNSEQIADAFSSGYAEAFWFGTGFAILGAIVVAALVRNAHGIRQPGAPPAPAPTATAEADPAESPGTG